MLRRLLLLFLPLFLLLISPARAEWGHEAEEVPIEMEEVETVVIQDSAADTDPAAGYIQSRLFPRPALLRAVRLKGLSLPAIDRANAPAAAVVTEQPAETAAGTETEAPEETAVPEATTAAPEAGGEAEEKAGPAAPAADAPVGTEIGNLLPDFSTDLLSGENFKLSDYRGRVVIINFWGTTCAPCVEELPYYEQLKVAHPDVEILAIHNRAGAKKAKDFLADKGWDHLDFALDSKEKGLLPLLNAADAMPQTIILDKQGVVTYNAQAPLTLEKLEALYNQANQ